MLCWKEVTKHQLHLKTLIWNLLDLDKLTTGSVLSHSTEGYSRRCLHSVVFTWRISNWYLSSLVSLSKLGYQEFRASPVKLFCPRKKKKEQKSSTHTNALIQIFQELCSLH